MQAPEEVLDTIVQSDIRPLFPSTVHQAISDLAIDCWARNSARRPSLVELGTTLKRALEVARPDEAQQRRPLGKEDELLNRMLPAHVAEALKARSRV